MKNITTHSEVIEIIDSNDSVELHIERNCGTNNVPFYLWNGAEKIAEGSLDLATDEDGDFTSELAWSILDECKGDWSAIREYDSLAAGK